MHAERIDQLVLLLLVDVITPWHVDELQRELDGDPKVRDAVARLVAAGLAHRIDGGFVCSSAAGRHVDEMDLIGT